MYQKRLRENKISFQEDALRSELWILCKRHRYTESFKIIDKIAQKYGHEILRLPLYHCELNAIELIWDEEKNFVARENTEMTLECAEKLFRRKREELTAELCKKCVDYQGDSWESPKVHLHQSQFTSV